MTTPEERRQSREERARIYARHAAERAGETPPVPGLADVVRAQGQQIEALKAALAACVTAAGMGEPEARPVLRVIAGGG